MPAMMLQRPCLMRIFIVPNLQRGNIDQDAPASPGWHRPSPGGVLFFACPKKRTKRKGSPAAETTPVDGLRNRRGKNSLRSDSLPLVPGSAPRRPAQRQRAVVLPRKPILPRTVRPGGASLPPHDRKFRGGLIVPTPQSQSGLGNAGRAPEGATIARSIPMGSCVLCRSPALRAILAPPAPQHHCPPGRLPPSTLPAPNQAHQSSPPGKRKRGARATPCPYHPYSLTTYSLNPSNQTPAPD